MIHFPVVKLILLKIYRKSQKTVLLGKVSLTGRLIGSKPELYIYLIYIILIMVCLIATTRIPLEDTFENKKKCKDINWLPEKAKR